MKKINVDGYLASEEDFLQGFNDTVRGLQIYLKSINGTKVDRKKADAIYKHVNHELEKIAVSIAYFDIGPDPNSPNFDKLVDAYDDLVEQMRTGAHIFDDVLQQLREQLHIKEEPVKLWERELYYAVMLE